MTYLELLSRIQAQTIDAFKVAQDAQLAALRAARDAAPAFTDPAHHATDAALALGYRMMAGGIGYARMLTATLAPLPVTEGTTAPDAATHVARADDLVEVAPEPTAPPPPVGMSPLPADVVADVVAAAPPVRPRLPKSTRKKPNR